MAGIPPALLLSSEIAKTTIACREILERCASLESLKIDSWAENRLADFNVWDSGLGASSNRRASLEDRLALKPHVRTAVSNLLTLYQNAIEIVKDLGLLHDERNRVETNGQTAQAKDAEDADQAAFHDVEEEPKVDDSTLPQAIENADMILNDLARLAALIRKAGTSSRLLRADASFDRQMQNYGDLRDHLCHVISCQPSALEDLRHVYWDRINPAVASALLEKGSEAESVVDEETVDMSYSTHAVDEIQERLVISNLRRSHRFAYSQRHGSKLENSSRQTKTAISTQTQVQTGSHGPSPMSKWKMTSGPKPGAVNEMDQMYTDQTEMPDYGAEDMTETAASEVETAVVKDIAKAPTPSQQAVTEFSTTGSRLRYPKPPHCKPGLVLFTCPCCCVPLPMIFADSRRWRKHLKDDVRPYTCVLPRCPDPATLYAEKSAWLDHMFNDHVASASWVCDICGDDETYNTEHGFIKHLLTVHRGAIPADQTTTFAEMCYKQTVEGISSCPLCSWAEDADGYFTNDQLLDHVAEHIHSFALRSLPWAPEKDEHDRNTFERAFEKVENWFAKCNPDVEGSGYRSCLPFEKPKTDPDNYFHTHEYFAATSRASSLAPTLSSVDWDDDDDEDEDGSDDETRSGLSSHAASEQGSVDEHAWGESSKATEPEYPVPPVTIKVIDARGRMVFMDPPETSASTEILQSSNRMTSGAENGAELRFIIEEPGIPSREESDATQLLPAGKIDIGKLKALLQDLFESEATLLSSRGDNFIRINAPRKLSSSEVVTLHI